MLRDRGQALVYQEFQAEMISTYQKLAPLEIWSPVANSQNQIDQFPLISHERLMTWCCWSAEERHWVACLEENGSKPIGGRITFNHKRLPEVRHGQNRRGGDGCLESCEGGAGGVGPGEAVLF